MNRRVLAALWVAFSAALVRPSLAQCPDGTPPPCAARRPGPAPAPNSVAVLYFDNLSRDTANAYLADGLTEELIVRLGQVRRLDVKSRFESQRVRDRRPPDPRVLGRALNAAYLVSGSFQQIGPRVRVNVSLVRTATGAQAWGNVYDRSGADLLAIQSDVASEVAQAITGQLLPEERATLARRPTRDPLAYDAYLHGVEAWHNFGDEAGLRSAVAYFNRAIARDSSFAGAYTGKAVAWSMLADGFVTPREGYGETRVAANRALELDSTQALAWSMLANAVLALDLDAPEAERLAHRAMALDPRGGWPHLILSGSLLAQGRMDGAFAEMSRAWQNDSLFSIMSVYSVMWLANSGHVDSAAALLARVRAFLPPTDVDPLDGLIRGARGDWRGAARLLDWRYYGGTFAGAYLRALLALGDTVRARATVDSMLAARTPGYFNPVGLARAYAALGDVDDGLHWLAVAFDERTVFAVWARQDPELALLRADPRYAALDRQLKF